VPGAEHLYVHLPFCSSRCGYCDFVTVVRRDAAGRAEEHGSYVDALLAELERERLAPTLATVYLGGGTPTFTSSPELERLLASLPPAEELTVEANPETVTPELARLLVASGVTRVSLGAQSFEPELLGVLDRVAQPDDVRRAFYAVRDAGIDNISLDLVYGIPGQEPSDLEADLAQVLALEPEHVSAYELEAKPGTRFTHEHGAELARQAEAMEGYVEAVVDALTGAGYRWYETANFCLPPERAAGRDLRARHNLAYWQGRDYLGIGIGAVSTIENRRWRNAPSLAGYLAALAGGGTPPRQVEELSAETRQTERVMLGLRLDEPLSLDGLDGAIDEAELERLQEGGLAVRRGGTLTLTRRGRFLGGGVTARLLA
jgi:putative oxygen-independent coproporphyrinogen III oxidase